MEVTQSRAGLKRLAQAIDEWRQERGLERWEDVAALHGPSLATLRVIRNGKAGEITQLTRMRIARITGWPRSYVDALLDGRPLPELNQPPGFERSIAENPRLTEDQRHVLRAWYRDEGGREYLDALKAAERARQA
jgi:hypothetical protein